MRDFELVPDEIVVDLLVKEIEALEGEEVVILEGFPRTKLQSMIMLERGFVPDQILVCY
jgi:adenylate kinase family enzyme